jgi:hypothetical protein
MSDTAVVDRPKDPLVDGGKRQPPKKPNDKMLLGFARNDDENDDPWGALGLEDPFK